MNSPYKVVPVEPTLSMMEAGGEAVLRTTTLDELETSKVIPAVWRAMLSASPALAPTDEAMRMLTEGLREAQIAIDSMKQTAETAAQYCEDEIVIDDLESISNRGLEADTAIRALLSRSPKVDTGTPSGDLNTPRSES
jgi:hypothetical protein